MKDILQEMILDFQASTPETGVERLLTIRQVARKATVLIGARRSGKTTYMMQIVQKLLQQGVPPSSMLYINFFDDRLHGLQQTGLQPVLEAYYGLFPEKKGSEMVYCFFDEIQMIPEWESFVDRLLRTEKCEVCITGSSAQLLSREIASQMRGRSLSWEVFPFSFREYLALRGIDATPPWTAKRRLIVQQAFEQYWQVGAFPETALLDQPLRVKIHQEYFQSMLFRDIVERHDVSHPRAVLDLAHRLIDNVASMYSVNSLAGHLKAIGHSVPKMVVGDYVKWFEDAYLLFTVRLRDASLARANANPKKIYCIDHALAVSVGSGVLVNSGHLLENLVFTALRRITSDVTYYRTSSGREVDFAARTPDRSMLLVQVCEHLRDQRTRERETTALAQAMEELRCSEGYIVTRDEQDTITVPSGTITAIPAWRFLLDLA